MRGNGSQVVSSVHFTVSKTRSDNVNTTLLREQFKKRCLNIKTYTNCLNIKIHFQWCLKPIIVKSKRFTWITAVNQTLFRLWCHFVAHSGNTTQLITTRASNLNSARGEDSWAFHISGTHLYSCCPRKWLGTVSDFITSVTKPSRFVVRFVEKVLSTCPPF